MAQLAPPRPPTLKSPLTPVDLDSVPQVATFLARAGLGALDPAAVACHLGRNDNWSGRTTTGDAVFVKSLAGSGLDGPARLRRLQRFEQARAAGTLPDVTAPAFLGVDGDHLLVAHTLLEDAVSAAELAAEDDLDDELGAACGRLVGRLHTGTTIPATPEPPHSLPPVGALRALPMPGYLDASGAQMEMWAMLQTDAAVVQALARLAADELAAEPVPTHGDLRLDQFLLAGTQLNLCDWEEFRYGDRARDLGAFAGEWLYRAVVAIPMAISAGAQFALDHEASHAEVLTHGVAALERLRPLVQAFCAGYRDVASACDPTTLDRAVRFTGWHLIDRMFAAAGEHSRLSAADRAAAGIGRTLLLAPDTFLDAVGLGGLR